MTTDRQRRANRDNARASTGPKTRKGKLHSAQNALRHGLNIPVWNDPALAAQADAIARKIAGPDVNIQTLEWARRIAEAQVDLNRVRSLRRGAIERMLSNPRDGSPFGGVRMVRILGRLLEGRKIRPADIGMMDQALHPKLLEGDAKLASILGDKSGELARLDRYERRALSKRKTAIRGCDAVRSVTEVQPINKKE